MKHLKSSLFCFFCFILFYVVLFLTEDENYVFQGAINAYFNKPCFAYPYPNISIITNDIMICKSAIIITKS